PRIDDILVLICECYQAWLLFAACCFVLFPPPPRRKRLRGLSRKEFMESRLPTPIGGWKTRTARTHALGSTGRSPIPGRSWTAFRDANGCSSDSQGTCAPSTEASRECEAAAISTRVKPPLRSRHCYA